MVLGTGDPAIRLVAWPVMHMAMNWALGSYRDSSTMRGAWGFYCYESSVKFTCTRPLYTETMIPSGSWPGPSCTWHAGLEGPYGLRDPKKGPAIRLAKGVGLASHAHGNELGFGVLLGQIVL